MDKSIAGLLGAVGALAVASPSHAAVSAPVDVSAAMQADSYADLLKPIPNALAVRQALEEQRSTEPAAPEIMKIQYYDHHHHHHHRYYRRQYHHHHHHHHHHRYDREGYRDGPGPGLRVGPLVIR